nr:MAG TPA: hypothetical protein [Caudoviricetes sp.]
MSGRAPFSVKLKGVFIERVPRCTMLSGCRRIIRSICSAD